MSKPFSWTASYLDFIAPLTPEQVLVANERGFTPESRYEWRWVSFARRLVWQYGGEGALHRLNRPDDLKGCCETECDLSLLMGFCAHV